MCDKKAIPIDKPLHIPKRNIKITRKIAEDAIANTKSNSAAARWIGVHMSTWKKYADQYGLYEGHNNQAGYGIKKGWATYHIKMEDILEGKIENSYPRATFKRRLIDEKFMLEECTLCGWNERNIVTEKICLALDFIDDDRKNFKYDNIRLLCPNCYYSNNGKFPHSQFFCV